MSPAQMPQRATPERATPERPAVSGIVLAGGRSSRFGRDKLAEPFGGGTLLEAAIGGLEGVVSEVVVVGREGPGVGHGRGAEPGAPERRWIPDSTPFEGPLPAVSTALQVVREPLAVVVGGDMPGLVGPVLAALIAALGTDTDGAAACLVYRGRRQPLPVALRVGAASATARELLAAGERSLVALLAHLSVREIAEADWRPLDPAAATLRDVDRPEDLEGN
jgi:molybdopterin-guanine dinucleotide biosynthesis protein A